MRLPSFIPFLSRPLTPTRRHHPPTCTRSPPSPSDSPDGTPSFFTSIQIPRGAQLEPSFLDKRLQSLRFGYESSNCNTPPTIRYRCANGHIVRSRLGSAACRFCPTCQLEGMNANAPGKKLTLCDIRALAAERKGVPVSTEYQNAHTPIVWSCQYGHKWKATVSNVRVGTWCPECARIRKKSTMQDMHEMARERGGQCLSTEYVGQHVKLRWRCAEGHEFLLAPNNIRRSSNGARKPSWCAVCAKEKRKLKSKKSSSLESSRIATEVKL